VYNMNYTPATLYKVEDKLYLRVREQNRFNTTALDDQAFLTDGGGRIQSFLCGGGLEYLHRNPASRKRRRKGNPVPGGITGPPCSGGI
jgi:hypothetical protein